MTGHVKFIVYFLDLVDFGGLWTTGLPKRPPWANIWTRGFFQEGFAGSWKIFLARLVDGCDLTFEIHGDYAVRGGIDHRQIAGRSFQLFPTRPCLWTWPLSRLSRNGVVAGPQFPPKAGHASRRAFGSRPPPITTWHP